MLEYMFFSFSKLHSNDIIKFDNQTIESGSSDKFFGIYSIT